MAKCTYGTGSFIMINTGHERKNSNNRLLTTIAWQIGDEIVYALEGSIFTSGSAVQWLRDGLNLFEHEAESENLAYSVEDNGGVVFVPALTGLGAPHWDSNARGSIFGITRGTSKAHIVRAALESIGFQVNDLLQCLTEDSDFPIAKLRVDGGAIKNNFLAQFQADLSRTEIIRPVNLESTALGAAYLAGIAIGFYDLAKLKEKWQAERTFQAQMNEEAAEDLVRLWLKGVSRSKGWIKA